MKIAMAKKKILALPEGDIFLKGDLELLKNHFDIRTAPFPEETQKMKSEACYFDDKPRT